ncbi:MAG: pro-sigmaK processing inhibitor BofA family protein [Defluviitaleaceae bacterium]|nr:pro-sigmaK processing inhibitor BofA family protein [Defluviitaleaceae bacterium]
MIVFALGIIFVVYLFYSRQFNWAAGVAKNSALGVFGILLANFLFPATIVGVNAVTVLVVGILGAPGFFLLFATSVLL